MGKLPVVGKENVCNKVKDQSVTMFWKPMASDVAKSGDFGYTYGIAELKSNSGEQKLNSYLRIWKKNKEMEWKIVLDLANPIPAETEKMQN
jgi:ketosteroid isomerase-like protein